MATTASLKGNDKEEQLLVQMDMTATATAAVSLSDVMTDEQVHETTVNKRNTNIYIKQA